MCLHLCGCLCAFYVAMRVIVCACMYVAVCMCLCMFVSNSGH